MLREDIGFCYRKRGHMKLLQKRGCRAEHFKRKRDHSASHVSVKLPTKRENRDFVAMGREALKYVERWLTDDHVGTHSRSGTKRPENDKQKFRSEQSPTKSQFQIQLLQIRVPG
jgi:hypothetical protein